METHKERILVVDDEASIRRILETRLSMIGYEVVTAADGEEAIQVFHETEPDLVVLDEFLANAKKSLSWITRW
ncbi:MAG: response regulator, partial [Microcystaceae cyanobacterium]